MNFVNLPVFILFFSAIYLISIYILLTLAQTIGRGDNPIAKNSEKIKNQVKVP